MRWVVKDTPRPFNRPDGESVPIISVAGWVPKPVATGAKKVDTTAIRSLDRPARSESLYHLRPPAQFIHTYIHTHTHTRVCPRNWVREVAHSFARWTLKRSL